MGSPLASQVSVDKENMEETLALTGESLEEERKEEEAPEKECRDLCWAPFLWFRMLADEMHWSFVLGVVIVYGVSQGLGDAIWKVASDYYWKDVQKVQPSAAQVYQGLTSLPWMVKPLWGLLTDVLPMAGYRRRPYFILAGLLGVISTLTLSLHNKLHITFALLAMTAARAGVAIADVTIDACITQNSISHPLLAADMQSLCGMSEAIGGLLGYSISGLLVNAIGSQGVLGLISIPSALIFSVGIVLKEIHIVNFAYREVGQKFLQASQSMWMTLKCPDVWRPCLYMYLSFALGINIHEGMFYWYTDRKSGLSFSQESIGFIFSFGSVGSFLGVLLYKNILKDYPFRGLLFWSQLLTSFAGMLDLILVFRLNLKLGMPNYFFAVIDRSISQLTGSIQRMPLLVLSSKLCPSGLEGTFFALLMSIENLGSLTSSWLGGLLLHMLRVTRTEFSNLWAAILIRSIMRLLPLALLFLVPKSDSNSTILPAEMLTVDDNVEALETEMDDVEMVSLVEKS